MTDGTGAVRARYDYDPYGRITKVSGDLEADFGFTGFYRHQASGLNLTVTRAYDADLGRWTSRDTIGENGGINLYGYVGGNPTNRVDPLGLKFNVVGDDAFKANFAMLISNLKKAHPKIERLIDELENSPHENMIIKWGPGLKNRIGKPKTDDSVEGDRQDGGSDTMAWLTLCGSNDEAGRFMSAEEVLAHELWHMWSYNNLFNSYLDNPNPKNGIDRDEEWAVRFQNLVPSADGGRKVYNDKNSLVVQPHFML